MKVDSIEETQKPPYPKYDTEVSHEKRIGKNSFFWAVLRARQILTIFEKIAKNGQKSTFDDIFYLS